VTDRHALLNRAYWNGQFAAASPKVEPTELLDAGGDVIAVIRQQVFDHDGNALTDAHTVYHRCSFAPDDRVTRMVVFTDLGEATAYPPSRGPRNLSIWPASKYS
jgi:hypothetical protein